MWRLLLHRLNVREARIGERADERRQNKLKHENRVTVTRRKAGSAEKRGTAVGQNADYDPPIYRTHTLAFYFH